MPKKIDNKDWAKGRFYASFVEYYYFDKVFKGFKGDQIRIWEDLC